MGAVRLLRAHAQELHHAGDYNSTTNLPSYEKKEKIRQENWTLNSEHVSPGKESA